MKAEVIIRADREAERALVEHVRKLFPQAKALQDVTLEGADARVKVAGVSVTFGVYVEEDAGT